MIFLLTQMFASLACALVAGGAIGWLVCRARTAPTVEVLRETVQRQRAQVEQARTDVSLISQDFDELEHRGREQMDASRQQIDALTDENRRLPPLHHNLEKSQLLVRQLMQKHEAQLRDLAAERDLLRSRLASQTDHEDTLRSVSAQLDQARRRLVTIDTAPPSYGAANTDSMHAGIDARSDRTAPPPAPGTGSDHRVDVASDTGADAGTGTAADPDQGVEPEAVPVRPPSSSWASARVPDIAGRGDAADGTVTHALAADDPDPLLDAIELDELDAAPEGVDEGVDEGESLAPDRASGTMIDPVSGDGAAALQDLDDGPLFDPVDRHDDLKRIFGIGPVTEQALNRLGITSYPQLAELERHDIETIADALRIFPGRIEDDDWVGNARRQLEDVLEEL